MAEETQQQSSQPEVQAPAGETQQQPETSGESTPEAVEGYWRNRQSGSDKAHSEETRVLREQLATAQAAAKANVTTEQGGNEAVAALQQQNRELQQQVQASESQRITDTRRAMYPNATEALADNQLISQMDEARLAALNTRLTEEQGTAPPTTRVDANNPGKGSTAPPKRLSDMSTDELKQTLEDSSAAWVETIRQQS